MIAAMLIVDVFYKQKKTLNIHRISLFVFFSVYFFYQPNKSRIRKQLLLVFIDSIHKYQIQLHITHRRVHFQMFMEMPLSDGF